jgi:hypothetical protein
MKQKLYRVVWEIDVYADTPLAAAKDAFETMQTPGTTSNYFTVKQKGKKPVNVDLESE